MPKTKRKVLRPKAKKVERDAVDLRGVEYDIKSAADLKVNKDVPELLALDTEVRTMVAESLTEDSVARMIHNLRRQMELIFYDEVPGEVLDDLSVDETRQIVDFFIERAELRA